MARGKICPQCLTERDPTSDSFCCEGVQVKFTQAALKDLCDILFDTNDRGDYFNHGILDSRIDALMSRINRAVWEA